jgi:hypothetical protein
MGSQANSPWLGGRPGVYTGPFRHNIAAFLKDHGQRIQAPFLKNVNVYLVRAPAAPRPCPAAARLAVARSRQLIGCRW